MPAKPPRGAGPGPSSKERTAKGKGKGCPICGKPATEASRPFCSERCRDVDLNRWLSNSYAIPGRKDADEDAE
jgi:endogenous inhibitor of DNA gyrase (YacG/DUF329 family)